MTLQLILISLLTLIASFIGTATGFGLSTIMVPVLAIFMPVPVTLLFVGIIHLVGDIWKIWLFRKGSEWGLIIMFGASGIAAGYVGASLALSAETFPLKRLLGAFLIAYVVFLLFNRQWFLPRNKGTALTGGALSGLFAGFFGVGGAIRSAFLVAFDLPKEVYIFTSGMIALFIDITRVSRYVLGGTGLEPHVLQTLAFCIPISFSGAYLAKRFLGRLPQKLFRRFVGVFLLLLGVYLIVRQ